MVPIGRFGYICRRGTGLRFALVGLLLYTFGFVHSGAAQSAVPEEPEVNPGRPTVATPATLTPIGYLQFETGGLAARNSPEFSTLYGINEVAKLTLSSRLQFIISVAPFERFRFDGISSNGSAEILLGAQAVLKRGEGAKPTIAISYFRRAREGSGSNLDIGSARNSILLLASADVHGFHCDANAFLNEQMQDLVRRAQFGQTLSVSHHLAGKFSLTGELWHFTQPFLRGHTIGNLWALGYTARKNLVIDAGFNRGFTRTSTRWEVLGGVTYLLPHRLWKAH
jgi:hypothetical protein